MTPEPTLGKAIFPGFHMKVDQACSRHGGLLEIRTDECYAMDAAKFRVTFKDGHAEDFVVTREDVVNDHYIEVVNAAAEKCRRYSYKAFGPGSWTTSLGATDWT